MIFSSAINRILIIKLRAIGDVVLSTAVIENLRAQFPNATIDFLTERFASDAVAGNPHLNSVVTFHKASESSLSLIQKIRKGNYNLVIDLFCNPRTALITFLSGAKYRIGYSFRGRRYAYNVLVTPRSGEVHNVEFNVDALRKLEIPIVTTNPVFFLSEDEKHFAREWKNSLHTEQNKIIVGLNTGGGWYTKKWKLEYFAALADMIVERHHAEIVLFWGPGEKDDVLHVQSLMKHRSHIIPKTTLKQMGALLQECNYIITNDSGPMHIAATLGVPTLGIFGPTNPHLQGPYGSKNEWVRNEELDCLGCNYTSCPINNVCMKDLSVTIVLQSFEKLVAK